MESKWSDRLSFKQITQSPPVMFALTGLLISAVLILLIQSYLEKDGRAQMFAALATLNSNLSQETVHAKGMGVAAMLGLTEPILKDAAAGWYAQDAPGVLKRLAIPRHYYHYDGIYVIDKNGVMIAHETDGKRSTGSVVSFRPYFQQAINGKESVYVAVGSATSARGIYYAAPLYEGETRNSPVIGVVLIKTSGELLDDLLKQSGAEGLLLSPQGVVFSATRSDWLYAMTPPFERKRVEAIAVLKQFGRQFDAHAPPVLPFDPLNDFIELDGRKFAVERVKLDLRDPGGDWTLVRLEALNSWFPLYAKFWLIIGVTCTAVLLGFYYQHQQRYREDAERLIQQERLEREQIERALLKEAQLRAQIAETGMQMRSAESLEELCSALMAALARLLDMRHGLFYVALESSRQLRLSGGYGVGVDRFGSTMEYGEGLAGQCAIERQSITLHAMPAHYWRVQSGTGSTLPNVLMLVPILRNDLLLGVLEIALMRELQEPDRALLDELAAMTSLNLDIVLRKLAQEEMKSQAA